MDANRGQLRFGIEFAPQPDRGATRDFAQTAEALGFDSLWIPDHPGVLGNATWTTLAALATVTNTILLGPLRSWMMMPMGTPSTGRSIKVQQGSRTPS